VAGGRIHYNQRFAAGLTIMSAPPTRHDLLRPRLDRFTRMSHGVEAGSANAIHRTRVATRRLREVLPVLQLEADTARKLGRALKRATRGLGAVRELDVVLALIEGLQASGRYPTHAVGQVAAEIRQSRVDAGRAISMHTLEAELQRLGRKLGAVAGELTEADQGGRNNPRAWRWAIDARVARRAAELQAAIDGAGALYLTERLHVVRIALKKLRYGLELATEAAGQRDSARLRTLKAVQALLGRLHDVQVLIDHVRRVQASLDPPNLGMGHELDAFVVALEDRCRRLHARYVRERTTLLTICGKLAARPEQLRRQGAARRAG
jgi:CHAD domain-containing protein